MNTKLIVDQLQNKVGECLQEVQQQLDQSFNTIEDFVEQLLFAPYPPVVHSTFNFEAQVTQIFLPSIQTFTNKLIQEVKLV